MNPLKWNNRLYIHNLVVPSTAVGDNHYQEAEVEKAQLESPPRQLLHRFLPLDDSMPVL